jgi:hypothetical protein
MQPVTLGYLLHSRPRYRRAEEGLRRITIIQDNPAILGFFHFPGWLVDDRTMVNSRLLFLTFLFHRRLLAPISFQMFPFLSLVVESDPY